MEKEEKEDEKQKKEEEKEQEDKQEKEEEKEEKEKEKEEWLVGRCRPVEAWPAANWPCNALMLLDPPAPSHTPLCSFNGTFKCSSAPLHL